MKISFALLIFSRQKGKLMASKEYFEEKSKLYYESYINNKSTRHVRGIIINDEGQVLLLYFKKRNGYSIPGGTVEENESIKDTVIREVFEETGAEIIPIKIVGKYYHTSKNFNYEGVTFDSNRVEYFYFCKFKGFKNNNLGLKGEFDDGYQVVLDGEWFNANNPYFESAYMTLPQISSLVENVRNGLGKWRN